MATLREALVQHQELSQIATAYRCASPWHHALHREQTAETLGKCWAQLSHTGLTPTSCIFRTIITPFSSTGAPFNLIFDLITQRNVNRIKLVNCSTDERQKPEMFLHTKFV